MGPAQLQLQARAQATMGRLVKGVISHYPDDETRHLAMFKMFLREASVLSGSLGKKIPPDHPKRNGVHNLKERIEEAIKDLEKNQGRLSMASLLKKIKLLEQLNPESISPAQINEIKKILKQLRHKIREEDYRRFQMMLDDEQEAQKLVAELIDMDKKYYAQSKKFREELEGYFVSVYKEAMELARLRATVEFLQKQLALINVQIEGLNKNIDEADKYLKEAAEKLTEIEENNKREAEHLAKLEKQKAENTKGAAALTQRARQNDNRLEERWRARHRGEKEQTPRLSFKELIAFGKRHHIKFAVLRRAVREGTFGELYKRYEGKPLPTPFPPTATPVHPPTELAGAQVAAVEQSKEEQAQSQQAQVIPTPVQVPTEAAVEAAGAPTTTAESQRALSEQQEAFRKASEELRVSEMAAEVSDADQDPDFEHDYDEGVEIANQQRESAAASAAIDRRMEASRASIDNYDREAAATRAGMATVAAQREQNIARRDELTARANLLSDELRDTQIKLDAAQNRPGNRPGGPGGGGSGGAAPIPPPTSPESDQDDDEFNVKRPTNR